MEQTNLNTSLNSDDNFHFQFYKQILLEDGTISIIWNEEASALEHSKWLEANFPNNQIEL